MRVLYRAAAADPRLAMEVRDEVVARYELALAAGVIPDAAVWTAWQALAEVHRRLDVAAAARGASPAVPSPDTPEAGGGATPLSDAQIVAVAQR